MVDCYQKKHRRKFMATVMKECDYNRPLTPKAMLRCIAAFLHRPFHGLFHFVFVVTVTQCTE